MTSPEDFSKSADDGMLDSARHLITRLVLKFNPKGGRIVGRLVSTFIFCLLLFGLIRKCGVYPMNGYAESGGVLWFVTWESETCPPISIIGVRLYAEVVQRTSQNTRAKALNSLKMWRKQWESSISPVNGGQ